MSILDSLRKKLTDKLSDRIAGKIHEVKHAAEAKAAAVKDAAAEKVKEAVSAKANEIASDYVKAARKRREEQAAAAAKKTPEELEAERKKAHEEAEHIAKSLAELQGIPLDENEEGSTPKKLRRSVEAFWQGLEAEWMEENQKNEGYVWTVTIDDAVTLDVMGLVKARYDMDLSASHVGRTMDGVYSGSMAFKFDADLSGLNAMLGSLGGQASTDHEDGWFRNDRFIMEFKPYNRIKEDAFVSTLNYSLEQLGSPEEDPQGAGKDPADLYAQTLLENMGSKPDAYEKENAPQSYWFDWEYNMTEGDMSQNYAVSGIMGMAGGYGSLDAAGEHLEAHGHAVSPFGGVYRDDISEDFHSPFPYVVHAYENSRVTLTLHSQKGGPVTVIFRGRIDRIPVEETTVVK